MKTQTTIFTAKRDDGGYLLALILEPGKSIPVERKDGGFEDIHDLQQRMRASYGEDAVFMPPSKFQKELEQRQIHTPEMIARLQQHGELLGKDLTHAFVYGSSLRPTNALFYGLEHAVHMQGNWAQTGYHTYIAASEPLDPDRIDKYDLTFVSRPQEEGNTDHELLQ